MSATALAARPPARIGRPRKFTDPDAFAEDVQAYFDACDQRERTPLVEGLCVHLGISRQTLLEYEGRVAGRPSPDTRFADVIKAARQRCELGAVERLLGPGHAAGPIFYLKNNFGWRDVQEVEHTTKLVVIGEPGQALEPPPIDITPLSPVENADPGEGVEKR